jgi:hypothetical protein
MIARMSNAIAQIEATPNKANRSSGLAASRVMRTLASITANGVGRRMPGCVGASWATGSSGGGMYHIYAPCLVILRPPSSPLSESPVA